MQERRTEDKAFALCVKEQDMEREEFYKSTKWKRKRAKILKRDGYMCQDCKRYGRIREATEVHHIKFLEFFPELALDDDNLVSLCHACHNARHPEKAVKSSKSRKERY